jgi:hypothetical protein
LHFYKKEFAKTIFCFGKSAGANDAGNTRRTWIVAQTAFFVDDFARGTGRSLFLFTVARVRNFSGVNVGCISGILAIDSMSKGNDALF